MYFVLNKRTQISNLFQITTIIQTRFQNFSFFFLKCIIITMWLAFQFISCKISVDGFSLFHRMGDLLAHVAALSVTSVCRLLRVRDLVFYQVS